MEIKDSRGEDGRGDEPVHEPGNELVHKRGDELVHELMEAATLVAEGHKLGDELFHEPGDGPGDGRCSSPRPSLPWLSLPWPSLLPRHVLAGPGSRCHVQRAATSRPSLTLSPTH